jgi:hypothetical protein
MFEVKIKNLQWIQTHGAKFDTEQEAQSWVNSVKNKPSAPWGKLERIIPIYQCSQEELDRALEIIPEVTEEIEIPAVLDEQGIEITPASQQTVIVQPAKARLPQEFSVEIIDLSSQILEETIAQKWTAFRADRDAKLSACDFTQLADAPLTSAEKLEYRNYRTYLRGAPDLHNDTTILTATVKTFEEYKAGLL